jgi:hypothetical protein
LLAGGAGLTIEIMVPTPVHPEVVLLLPKRKHADAVIAVDAMLSAVDGNTYFPGAGPLVAAARDALRDYAKAVSDAKNRVPGAVGVRGEARVALVKALAPIRASVQLAVDAHIDLAVTIAESAKMKLRKPSSRRKANFAVEDGPLSGQVHLLVKALAKALLYFWEVSTDKVHWAVALDTSAANAIIADLTPGQTYYFRFRVRTRTGLTDYSQILSHIVR